MTTRNTSDSTPNGRLLKEESGKLEIAGDLYPVRIEHYESGSVIKLENGQQYIGPSMNTMPIETGTGINYSSLRAQEGESFDSSLGMIVHLMRKRT